MRKTDALKQNLPETSFLMFPIPCVIFAGGKSSRMEKDKSLLPFGSYPTLTQYQHARLSKIFSRVYISCKNSNKFGFDANYIEDKRFTPEIFAPTVGFLSIFETLQDERVFILSVDSPFVTRNEIAKLFHADKAHNDATIAKTQDGIQPLCGIYHRSMLPKLQHMIHTNEHKLSKTLHNAKTTFVSFEENRPFFNLNYPQEYQEACKLFNSLL